MIRSLTPPSDVIHQRLIFGSPLGNLVFDKTYLGEIDGEKCTVAEAVALLSEHNYLALPVYRMETEPKGLASAIQHKVYYGFISTYDVVVCLVERLASQKYKDITECLTTLYALPCSVLISTPESSTLAVEEPTTLLRSVFNLFANPSRHIHRILVRQRRASPNEASSLRILEQEDVIRFLLCNADQLGGFVYRSINDLEMLKDRSIISITEKETALDACRKMVKEDVNALAIINSVGGNVVGTFSSTDVRGLTPENARLLDLPVCEYLKELHFGVQPSPVICVPGSQLYSVMAQAQMAGVFRVWVVNEMGIPFNVITLTDILEQFLIRAYREEI
jgi:CBS domain-containing protein